MLSAPVVDFYEEIAAGLSDDEGKKPRRNVCSDFYNESELKLQCCVLMLDVILKQVCILGSKFKIFARMFDIYSYFRWSYII